MSSIASLNRIELRPGVSDALIALIPVMVGSLLLTLLLTGFQPFAAGSVMAAENTGGNKLNQIGYSALGLAGMASIALMADRRRLLTMPSIFWAGAVLIYLYAVSHSPDRAGALRGMAFSFTAVIAMISAVLLVRSARMLQTMLAVAALTVLGMSYFGVVVWPAAATHLVEVFEPANQGLWRGIYQHKNTAGPVMACFTFIGIYLIRSRRYWLGWTVFILATIFLLQTGSKTSAGTVLMVLLAVLLPSMFGLRALAVAVFAFLFSAFVVFTNGVAIWQTAYDIVQKIAPGTTYTGRYALWHFSVGKIAEKPWSGWGLNALWSTPAVMEMERPFEADWDFRGIVHGHSSYLDMTLDVGIPSAIFIVFILIVLPSFDYLRTRSMRSNIIAADLFLMILIFTALNAFMEVLFFHRGDPVWMLMVLAVAGMRRVATEPLVSGRA